MTVAELTNEIVNSDLTRPDLDLIANFTAEHAEELEGAYADFFVLGDRVKIAGTKGVRTVVRRNKLSVTVADSYGSTTKITPSDIVEVIEPGNPDEFHYWDFFGDSR